ncbi:MAG: phage holin family protein [Clostridia bacterium]|jgi:uncharacterized membrane protein YvlD (DUF360 family)|nr:phage holin family protein [Clostridia bacterium]
MSSSQSETNQNTGSGVWQVVGRLIAAAVVLAITAFFTPGFTINNIWALAIATVVLAVMDYLISKFTGIQASPFGKGFVGFALAAITLYVTQFFVAGYSISWMAAIIGALIYGVVDYFLPGSTRM